MFEIISNSKDVLVNCARRAAFRDRLFLSPPRKGLVLFRLAVRFLILVFVLGAPAPAFAAGAPQVWGQDSGFRPFDIRAEIRAHFARRLPRGWYVGDPMKTDNGYNLRLIIDWEWKGNPVSATLNLCPPRQSVIWQHIKRLYVTPSHRSLRYAGVECQ